MISVCIATYNGEKYIRPQIESIIVQLDPEDEIVISDDGSTDDTLNIIASFADDRIKVFDHSRDKKQKVKYSFEHVTRNFENALRHAKGDLIFLSDQDDIWCQGKVRTVKQLFENNDCLLILHDCSVIDVDETVINESYFAANRSHKGFIRNILNNAYLGCCMAFRRELLDEALPLPEAPVPHDIWLGLIAEWHKAVRLCSMPLILYRRHGANTSSAAGKSRLSFTDRISYRLTLLSNVLRRLLIKK